MARTRFDQDICQTTSNKKVSLDAGVEHDLAELRHAANHRNTNPNTIKFIDPNLDPKYAISRIQLPPKTMYLIDKVVRAKALQGPIGTNNSEVINLEQERELRKKNLYYANLAEQKRPRPQAIDEDDNEDQENSDREQMAIGRNSKGEFVDMEDLEMDD